MAVNVVRNSNVVRGVNQQLPFADRSLYEAAKNTPGAIKRAIDAAIMGTSVTIVLNGPSTWASYWVRYEIAKSFEKGNGFLVIDLDGVGPKPILTAGPNPLRYMGGAADEQSPATISIFECASTTSDWTSFSSLPKVKNADAKYPHSLIAGGYNFQQRFTRHMTWNSVAGYFSSTIEVAAKDAGWPPLA